MVNFFRLFKENHVRKVLVVMEMAGSVNALEKSLAVLEKEHGWYFKYAASDVALNLLTKKGIFCETVNSDVQEVFEKFGPEIVITGISAFRRDNPKWTGLELKYALAAMDRNIPVAMYRDYSGIAPWAEEAAKHPGARHLLNFLMFDEATAMAVNRRNWPCSSIDVVGSGYYDNLADYDKKKERENARRLLGLKETDIMVFFNPGAEKNRVLEILEPTINAFTTLPDQVTQRFVFVPTFHPKDPDAPAAYESALAALQGRMRVIKDSDLRAALSNPVSRIIASDFIVMNAASTDTWTAAYLGIPMVIPLTPLTRADLEKNLVNPDDLDLVKHGVAASVSSVEHLKSFIKYLCLNYDEVMKDLRSMASKASSRTSGSDSVVIASALASIAS